MKKYELLEKMEINYWKRQKKMNQHNKKEIKNINKILQAIEENINEKKR